MGFALSDDDALEFLSLSLGTLVGSDASLQELEGTLILGDTKHFQDAALVWSESGDLADELTDDLQIEFNYYLAWKPRKNYLGLLGGDSLVSVLTLLDWESGSSVSLVETEGKSFNSRSAHSKSSYLGSTSEKRTTKCK